MSEPQIGHAIEKPLVYNGMRCRLTEIFESFFSEKNL